jgi:serine/threonine-protein kinase ULK4
MAPELFQEGGVHSFASDLWALGCVLYECYAGRPPFVANEFTQLVKSIISDSTPPLRSNASKEFLDLVNHLLLKDPAERMHWPELREHAFWKSTVKALPLPQQPAFNNLLQLYSKSVPPETCQRNAENNISDRDQEWKAHGARGFFNNFSICCLFLSGVLS